MTLTAVAGNESTFTGLSGDCLGIGDCSVAMEQAHNVTATFTLNQYPLTVAIAGAGSGRVTIDPVGIDCMDDCSQDYDYGAVVKLTAVTNIGSNFSGWSSACTNTTGDCVVTMEQTHNVSATFTTFDDPYALTVTTVGTGIVSVSSDPVGIDCGSDCSESYPYETVVTLTVVVESGSTFVGWDGACTNTSDDCVVTMNQVQNVTATFVMIDIEYFIFLPMIQ